MPATPSGTGKTDTITGRKTSRSNPYTISSTDVANSYCQPIETLWVDNQGNPDPFVDGAFTLSCDLEVLHAINTPQGAVANVAYAQKNFDVSGAGQNKCVGVTTIVALGNKAVAGDVLVVHVIADHD
jgi:hypothetical protein